jgi:hypothetical protein
VNLAYRLRVAAACIFTLCRSASCVAFTLALAALREAKLVIPLASLSTTIPLYESRICRQADQVPFSNSKLCFGRGITKEDYVAHHVRCSKATAFLPTIESAHPDDCGAQAVKNYHSRHPSVDKRVITVLHRIAWCYLNLKRTQRREHRRSPDLEGG